MEVVNTDEWIYANSGLLAGVCVLFLLDCFEFSGWIPFFLMDFLNISVFASVLHRLMYFYLYFNPYIVNADWKQFFLYLLLKLANQGIYNTESFCLL
jgi:hypothetical protein